MDIGQWIQNWSMDSKGDKMEGSANEMIKKALGISELMDYSNLDEYKRKLTPGRKYEIVLDDC